MSLFLKVFFYDAIFISIQFLKVLQMYPCKSWKTEICILLWWTSWYCFKKISIDKRRYSQLKILWVRVMNNELISQASRVQCKSFWFLLFLEQTIFTYLYAQHELKYMSHYSEVSQVIFIFLFRASSLLQTMKIKIFIILHYAAP